MVYRHRSGHRYLASLYSSISRRFLFTGTGKQPRISISCSQAPNIQTSPSSLLPSHRCCHYLPLSHLKRLDAPHEYLPHANAEHPDVAGCGETPEVDGFWGHPFDRQLSLRSLVVRLFLDFAGKSKIAQLDRIVIWREVGRQREDDDMG